MVASISLLNVLNNATLSLRTGVASEQHGAGYAAHPAAKTGYDPQTPNPKPEYLPYTLNLTPRHHPRQTAGPSARLQEQSAGGGGRDDRAR